MEPHSDDGTHRLELPVSRTTLKTWGGVPTEISEKSGSLLANDVERIIEVDAYTERSRSC